MPSPSVAATPAFRALYEERHAFVWGVLRRLGVPERDVEDLLQDVFVIVHRRLDDFEGRAATTTWLYGIAVRVYWNYARRQRRRLPLATESASAMPILDDSVGPERFAAHNEASALLEQLLGGLDPDKRTAFVLAEIEGLSAPEIAAVTGTKTRTIYSRIRAARELVEASARRVEARERNDVSVRRVARASTAQPPMGLQRRAWAALMVRLPELAPVSVAASWASSKIAVAMIGIVGVGGVAVATSWSAAPEASSPPSVEPVALASATPMPEPAPRRASPIVEAPADMSSEDIVEPDVSAAPGPAAPSPTARPRETSNPSTVSELDLLQQARAALKSERPEEALRLLERHGQRHPDSQLARERERTRLVALCALGRAEESAQRAEAEGLPKACG